MAERVPKNFGADPLNLMRVMPPQGGPTPDWRCLSHAFFSTWLFVYLNLETTNSGTSD